MPGRISRLKKQGNDRTIRSFYESHGTRALPALLIQRCQFRSTICRKKIPMQTQPFCTQLVQSLHLPGLAFNEQGCARIVFDGKVTIDLEHDPVAGELHLRSDLAPLPAIGGEALYRSLLQANLPGQQTLGATLAIDEVEGQIVLSRSLLVAALGPDELLDLLQRFCASAAYWRQTLSQAPLGNTPAIALAPAPSFGNFVRA